MKLNAKTGKVRRPWNIGQGHKLMHAFQKALLDVRWFQVETNLTITVTVKVEANADSWTYKLTNRQADDWTRGKSDPYICLAERRHNKNHCWMMILITGH